MVYKIDRLRKWLQKRKYVKTSQINSWGATWYYTSAMRRVREIAEREDWIRRLDRKEKDSLARFKNLKEEVYIIGRV